MLKFSDAFGDQGGTRLHKGDHQRGSGFWTFRGGGSFPPMSPPYAYVCT